MLQTLANVVADSALNQWIQATYWLWPLLEILHFIGLSLLFGGLLIVDLRMLGCFPQIDQAKTFRLLSLVGLGFGINLVTGLLFFFGDPQRYVINIAFQIKMLLILLAGANAVLFHLRVQAAAINASSPLAANLPRVSASISLLTWTAVLLMGRLIPYLGTG